MRDIIIAVISMICGGGILMATAGKKLLEQLEKERQRANRNGLMFRAMTRWVRLRQKGINLGDELARRGYHHIAIYGMSSVGECLLEELRDTEVSVDYGIDRNAKNLYACIDLCTPDEELKPVDAVVVTVLGYFDEVEDLLTKRLDCPILALDDLMYQ